MDEFDEFFGVEVNPCPPEPSRSVGETWQEGDVWHVCLFDPEALKRGIADADSDGARASALLTLRRRHDRQLAVANEDQIQRIIEVRDSAPHMSQVIEIVLTALRASEATHTPISIPPVLMLGPPGCGKTHLACEIARALDLPSRVVDAPNLNSGAGFTGTDRSWKNPKPGIVAELLAAHDSPSQVIIIDEIDKPCRLAGYSDALMPLHSILEPVSARSMRDECLEMVLDASHLFWFATANDLAGMASSLIDRFIVIDCQAPSPDQADRVIRSIYETARRRWGSWFAPDLPDEVIERVKALPPRRVRRVLGMTLARVASLRSHEIMACDVDYAMALLERGETRHKVGFV
ncbi:MAG: AAA family ATPase [Proteobacteria bacterium]|nr:AAA family ATPase [Pseudomonadota bacterium]